MNLLLLKKSGICGSPWGMSATRQYKQPFNFSTIVMSEEDVATVVLPDS